MIKDIDNMAGGVFELIKKNPKLVTPIKDFKAHIITEKRKWRNDALKGMIKLRFKPILSYMIFNFIWMKQRLWQ